MTSNESGMPLVSIVMPTYNSAAYVAAAIDSIRGQTYLNWELLITDDCSRDQTISLVQEYCEKDKRISLFQFSDNQGAAKARNRSIESANGVYIAFLDSDDCWKKNKLSTQVEYMQRTECTLSFSAYETMDEHGHLLGAEIDIGAPDLLTYKQLLYKKATFGCLTVMFKQSAFSDSLMPDIRTGQDYALWLKLLRQVDAAHKVPGVLAEYRIVPGSISRNKFRKALRQWEIYRRLERLSLLEALLAFRSYAWRAVFRH